MEKFIPYEKLSKKKKRELNAKKRSTWGSLNPVTRTPANSRAYNRQKARRWKREAFPAVPFDCLDERCLASGSRALTPRPVRF